MVNVYAATLYCLDKELGQTDKRTNFFNADMCQRMASLSKNRLAKRTYVAFITGMSEPNFESDLQYLQGALDKEHF